MERFRLLRTLLSFKTGFMRYNWYTKNLYIFNVHNFLTTVHFRVNKLFSSVTPFILKVTCYKKLVWIWNCSWTHSNITKTMWRAKVSFSIVLMLILIWYFICITHYFWTLFKCSKRLFYPHFNFSKDIREFDTWKFWDLKRLSKLRNPVLWQQAPCLAMKHLI